MIDTGGGVKDGAKKKMKKQEATLLELKFLLNSLGQVVVEKSTIDPELFRQAFDKKLPQYPNTIVLENFITRINNLADKFVEDAEIF